MRTFFLKILLLHVSQSTPLCEPVTPRKGVLFSILNELENLEYHVANKLRSIETSLSISRTVKNVKIQELIDGESNPEQKRFLTTIRKYFEERESLAEAVLRAERKALFPNSRSVAQNIIDIRSNVSLTPREIEEKVGSIFNAASEEIKDELELVSKSLEDKFPDDGSSAQAALLQRYLSIVPTFKGR